jgi:hypothetical protein
MLAKIIKEARTEATAIAEIEKHLLEYDADLKERGIAPVQRQIEVQRMRMLLRAKISDLFGGKE